MKQTEKITYSHYLGSYEALKKPEKLKTKFMENTVRTTMR